jgi:quercetin dioxygenase-like cupin family protein
MLKITTTKLPVFIFITFVAIFLINIKTVSALEKPSLNKAVLLEKAVELDSNKVNARMIRVTFPPAFKTPWHTHEGPGPRYVVKGKLKVVEEGKTNTYSVGDVFWESGSLMSVENLDQETAEIIIFELAPSK